METRQQAAVVAAVREKGVHRVKKVIVMLLLVACSLAAGAQVPQDVPRDHWAYEAVRDLADQGYVLGYPDGSFLGSRTMTRYEFATVIKRILDDMQMRIQAAGDKTPTTTPAPVVTTPPAGSGVGQADLDKLSRLVDEFKVELTVIGTRLDKVEAEVAEMRTQIETHEAILTDEEGALKSTQADVSKLKKIGIGGYLQVRYQTYDFTKENDNEDKFDDTFLVRRGRVKFTFKPTARTFAVIQPEFAKNGVSLKDAYLNYALGENAAISPSFQIGQQNWWFGYEVPYSSSRRETPERALFVRRFFPGERDTGAVLLAPSESDFQYALGIYNGTGIEVGSNSATDLNEAKDYLARLKWAAGDLDFGVSGYWGTGVWNKYEKGQYAPTVDKTRYGADLQWYFNNFTLKAEYIRGKGFDLASGSWDQSEDTYGYYGQINYNLSVKDTLVARYAFMEVDPQAPQYGERTAWDLGWVRWLDDNMRFKLFYKINDEELNEFDNNGLAAEWIVTY